MVAIYWSNDECPTKESTTYSTIGYLDSMDSKEVVLARQLIGKDEMEDFVHIPMNKVFQYGKL